MKKLISAVLAVVLLAMCGISVFAVEINKDTPEPQNGDVVVLTTVELEDVTYSITIPADKPIEWGYTGETYMDYTVTMQPDLGGQVKVSVEGTNLSSAGGNTLGYTSTGFAEQTFKAESVAQINTALSPKTRVAVTVLDWTGVPIAEYRATLTYTVAYTPGSIS